MNNWILCFNILAPGSKLNPFFRKKCKKRNNLIFLLLHCFWPENRWTFESANWWYRFCRIDNCKNKKKTNDKTDPWVYQPLVKTCERKLIADKSSCLKFQIIYSEWSKKHKNSNKHDFLFITYKEGKTQEPISFSSYHKVVSVVRQSSSLLGGLTGHKLRHTWNYEFSKAIDKESGHIRWKEQQIRSYLMGWRPGSETSMIYNRRHIYELSKNCTWTTRATIQRRIWWII